MKVYTASGLPKQSTLDLLTAKGDLLTRTSSLNTRLGVGADNTVLAADSAQTEGVSWKTVLALLHTALGTKGDIFADTGSAAVRMGIGANGAALIGSSTSANGATYGVPAGAAVGQFVGTGTVDQRWTGAVSAAAPSVIGHAVGSLRAYPVYIPRICTIDRIMFEQTGAASGTGVARVGIYASTSDTNPAPGALVYDGGEFSTNSASATVYDKTISPAVTLAGPGIFWFTNLSGTSLATCRSLAPGSIMPLLGWPATGGANMQTAAVRTFAYAALPDPFGALTSIATSGVAAVGVRFAS